MTVHDKSNQNNIQYKSGDNRYDASDASDYKDIFGIWLDMLRG